MFTMLAGVLSLLGLLASSAHAQDINACPTGFTSFGESCYAYMQGKQSWTDAQAVCVSVHAHLAEIYSAEELSFLQNMSIANGDHDVWLGAHDLIQEGLWVWAWSGSDMEFKAWEAGQPDGGGGSDGDENCMELDDDDASHMWNDEDCHHEKHFICQRSKYDISG